MAIFCIVSSRCVNEVRGKSLTSLHESNPDCEAIAFFGGKVAGNFRRVIHVCTGNGKGRKTMTGVFRRIIQAGGARLAVKAAKAIPLVGTAVAIGLVGYEVKKKGLIKGLTNTALDATPFVGVAKNAIELFTGDWLPDKVSERAHAAQAELSRRKAQQLPTAG
jgi:hypothetical protein